MCLIYDCKKNPGCNKSVKLSKGQTFFVFKWNSFELLIVNVVLIVYT